MTELLDTGGAGEVARLVDLIGSARRLVVLTGAGISTESGIPDYRSPGGLWSKHKPVYYADFVRSPQARQRYWARSMAGWRSFHRAVPNAAHTALAALEARGRLQFLITQNVDRLHLDAGSRAVLELHGHNDSIICLGCRDVTSREAMQAALHDLNPTWSAQALAIAPDGDAEIDTRLFAGFRVPRCAHCGGILKPYVIFFGESVPAAWVARATAEVAGCDALLIAGSSLTVWSGYRFARQVAQAGTPLAIVNLGPTRADPIATLKIEQRLGSFLPAVVAALAERGVRSAERVEV